MLEDFTYCFILKLSSAEEMYFTSFDKEIICDGMKFAPNSGLEIDVIEMNDSANNYVKIRGFFEENGMTKNIYLERSEISVCFYFFRERIISKWLKYDFYKREINGNSFTITFTSTYFRMKASLLKNYSKNCRANFGDANCSVNLEDYSFTSKISHFDGNKIWITDTIKSNIEYENIVFNNNLISKIADYYHKVIILDAPVSDIKIGEIVILRPRCDKNFETCCNKYDNAVNFRGEPFI